MKTEMFYLKRQTDPDVKKRNPFFLFIEYEFA